jgi:hypothetical protein
MRDGILIRLRSRALPLALSVGALLAGVLLPAPEAAAKLDPLRIVTGQIIRPNIMVVLDTSGSMSMPPSDNNWTADVIGGDCYNGEGVCKSGLNPECPSGTACSAANTCTDGATTCAPGTNKFCGDNSACLTGNLCGTTASPTACPASTKKCQDGTGCFLCTDGVNRCTTSADCPAAHGTCTGHCRGSSGTSCTTDSQCPNSRTCDSSSRCRGDSCSSTSDCYGTMDACTGGSGKTCRWYPPDGACNSGTAGSECQQCVRTCSNAKNTACTTDNDCPLQTNTCQTGGTACATCNYWCGDGTACFSGSYCNNTGSVTACAQECNDANGCYAASHCGTGPCTYPSSRLAIAKSVIKDLMLSTADVINYGLMTLDQDGYFPYLSTGSTPVTRDQYFSLEHLIRWGGWNWTTGAPKSSFTRRGTTYTLLATGGDGNARYDCRQGGGNTHHDWCGSPCVIGGRTCRYKGSVYQYSQQQQSSSPKLCYASSYQGPTITCDSAHGCPQSGSSTGCSGLTVSYYQFPWNYGYTSSSVYVEGDQSSYSSCTHSANEDGAVRVPIISSADENTQTARDDVTSQITDWLAMQVEGGAVARGGTPTGCTLQYNLAGTTGPTSSLYYDAYTYLSDHKTADTLDSCRTNAIILVTDGEPNGPGDDSCGSTACGTDSLSGCSCRAVKAAKNLYANKNIKVYTIGFGVDTAGSKTLDNIARAGGVTQRADTHYAYYASNETDLAASLREAAYLAAKGDYATSQPTVATSSGATLGSDYALLSSTEFPTWNGHLRAYQLDTNPAHTTPDAPTQVWDAGTQLASRTWSTRRVWTSDPNSGHALVPFMVSGSTNAATLYNLGLGASTTEADAIIQFTLGNGRSWRLGPMINSTPASHGKGVNLNLDGHAAFLTAKDFANRPKMVYVGSDDGMLHAFYLETNGSQWSGGDEAWAYVPPDLLPSLTRLWLAGGQPTDPSAHIFGVANSPKVNDVCSGSCASASDWKSVVVSGEGPGGKGYFALDISEMPNATTPFTVLWHTMSISSYANTLGQSWSMPAYAFAGSSPVVSLLLFGSGYDANLSDAYDQGAWLHVARATTGAAFISAAHLSAPSSPKTTYAVLADTVVATAAATDTSSSPPQPLAVAAYQADLGGRLWRLPNANTSPGSTPFFDLGVDHPYYYSPAAIVESGSKVYLALNDSTYDDTDMNQSGSPTPNLTILQDDGGTLVPMAIAANSSSYTNWVPLTSLCKAGCSGGTCSCASAANRFTATARPVSSPVIIKNSLGTANYQAAFLVYQPSASSCTQGNSYVVVLDITDTPITQSYVKDAGTGKASGLSLGAGGQMLVAKSGSGTNAASLQVAAGNAQAGGTISSTPTARVMGIQEMDN